MCGPHLLYLKPKTSLNLLLYNHCLQPPSPPSTQAPANPPPSTAPPFTTTSFHHHTTLPLSTKQPQTHQIAHKPS
ncbi:hypothetical protein HanRHA438_Chr15g0731201 [Helianthus annuus]|nr:hypothetical protein HanRHA438_Chr15g0731201 [Helianthus annuus]